MRIVMLGDIVGKPGKRVVQQQIGKLRELYEPHLIIANAENIAGGSGLTASLYSKLMNYGIDAITLGDHALRQSDIYPVLDQQDNIIRPANLPNAAPGRGMMRLTLDKPAADSAVREVYVITVLGRLYMHTVQADDPYATVDRLLEQVPDDAGVIVEVHAEATSEKVAMGWHLEGRASAVVGTHTHIPTADTRILPRGTAYQTDLGMTGPYGSILGRRVDRVLQFMTTAMPAKFDIAEQDVRMCGIFVELAEQGRAKQVQRVELAADMDQPPFI